MTAHLQEWKEGESPVEIEEPRGLTAIKGGCGKILFYGEPISDIEASRMFNSSFRAGRTSDIL